MLILPIHKEIFLYLKKRQLLKLFQKQCMFLMNNLSYPSLNVELLEPGSLKIYSFRINKQYRAIFIFRGPNIIEIIDVNDHYQ